MTALNPNHEVTKHAQENWHKLAALLLAQLGGRATITAADIAEMADGPDQTVVVHYHSDSIEMYMVGAEEAQRLAIQAGGLPS